MRDFYKQTLSRTYEIFGVNQLAKMEDEQVTYLLDALERVSALYNYISPEDQKTIINKRLITDKDYSNINARLIASWFEQDGKVFFKGTSSYVEPEVKAEPLTGEDREKWLKKWQEEVAKFNATNSATEQKNSGSRMREQLYGNITEEQMIEIQKAREQAAESKRRKEEYFFTNYDQETKNALETWIPFDEWLRKHYPESETKLP